MKEKKLSQKAQDYVRRIRIPGGSNASTVFVKARAAYVAGYRAAQRDRAKAVLEGLGVGL